MPALSDGEAGGCLESRVGRSLSAHVHPGLVPVGPGRYRRFWSFPVADKGWFAFEIDGVTPDTVDTNQLLRLASAYFDQLCRLKAGKGLELKFQGLQIKKACVQVLARPNRMPVAKAAVAQLGRILHGRELPSPGTQELTARLRRELQLLPPDQKAKAVAGKWSRVVSAPELNELPGLWEITEIRARIVRVGGLHEPTALVDIEAQGAVVLRVDRETARSLGSRLYCLADIEAEVLRDADGNITTGRVLTVNAVQECANEAETWRNWYRAAASGWDDVDDIEGELGRNHD